MDALRFDSMPELRHPYLLLTFAGWSDAAGVGTAAGRFLVEHLQAQRFAYLAAVEDGLAAGWGARGKAATRLRATIGLALDFLAWRTLYERGLSRTEAIAVMSSAVRAAAG